MTLINNNLLKLVQGTVKKFIDPKAEVLSIESTPINMGIQAVELMRHSVLIKILDETSKLSLVSKHATRIERQVLTRLYSQKVSAPFSLSYGSEVDERSLICIQDVDYQTDYRNINIRLLQKSETNALSHIHISNFGQRKELSWLPEVDSFHIEKMIYERWKPQWQAAKGNEQFIDVFGEYIPLVEAVANTIFEDIQYVINDENSRTLIHNDLNPGNVLVQNNTDVIFIDWEEARYGSLFLDIPLRCGTSEQIEEYRGLLAAKSIEFPDVHFNQMYAIASRYLGLRYMSWNLGAWTSNSHAKDDLKKYLDMVV
ncbi:phosphotransferase [Paenibacillus sp. FSL K6-0276]|uniref:phosphotransferase n=1 Tax=Paenibacillus sp. FSL K6-0276 TaxID=2921450 RepID=UPI0030EE3A7F